MILHNMGFFGLSGALTNWLAIIMLFEKIPFLYGSGVIALHFEEFKAGIKNLLMVEFFTPRNIEAVLSDVQLTQEKWDCIGASIDYDKLYQSLVEGVLESKLGKMLSLMGAQSALESMKEPIIEKLKAAVSQMWSNETFQAQVLTKLGLDNLKERFYATIDKVVEQRLQQLTPNMVRDIIQAMIRKHLGWLIVWGGVFGALIGLVTSFI